MNLLKRVNGILNLQSLDTEIFFGDLYESCKNEKEVNWLRNQLDDISDCIAEERLEELDRE